MSLDVERRYQYNDSINPELKDTLDKVEDIITASPLLHSQWPLVFSTLAPFSDILGMQRYKLKEFAKEVREKGIVDTLKPSDSRRCYHIYSDNLRALIAVAYVYNQDIVKGEIPNSHSKRRFSYLQRLTQRTRELLGEDDLKRLIKDQTKYRKI